MAESGNAFGQETLSTPPSAARETLRSQESTETASCTIYSVQAVAGVATAGCARVGVDYGRRE